MLQRLLEMFISKKKVIAIVSALLIALVAAVLGMSAQEVRDAVISGPTIELPKAADPAPAPALAPIIPVAPSEKKK